jgi:hypothetical protein
MDCERAQEGTGKSGKGVCMILSDQLIVDNGDFVVEHLYDSTDNRHSVDSFASGNNAQGLDLYLKNFALNDELSNESRTYLVKDSLSKALACYFSLRTCLVPIALTKSLFTTVSAVELANFAVNENYRKKQRAIKKIGAYVFLEFILPIVKHIANLVGARWLCVYALPDEKLIRYYESLGFARLSKEQEEFVYSHVKPKYDKNCIFMYQSIISN